MTTPRVPRTILDSAPELSNAERAALAKLTL